MTPSELAKLMIEKADKATQGAWISRKGAGQFDTPTIEKSAGGILAQMTHYYPMNEDAEHIATACPENLLKVLKAAEAMAEALEYYVDEGNTRDGNYPMADTARKALAAWRGEV